MLYNGVGPCIRLVVGVTAKNAPRIPGFRSDYSSRYLPSQRAAIAQRLREMEGKEEGDKDEVDIDIAAARKRELRSERRH